MKWFMATMAVLAGGCGQVSYDGFSSATLFKDVAIQKAVVWKVNPDGSQVYVELQGGSTTNADAIRAAVEAGIAVGKQVRP